MEDARSLQVHLTGGDLKCVTAHVAVVTGGPGCATELACWQLANNMQALVIPLPIFTLW